MWMPVNRPVFFAGLSQYVTTHEGLSTQPGSPPRASTRRPAARARPTRSLMPGSWLDVVTLGGTATNSWSMPVLTARSTVAAGVLVSQTHMARVPGPGVVAAAAAGAVANVPAAAARTATVVTAILAARAAREGRMSPDQRGGWLERVGRRDVKNMQGSGRQLVETLPVSEMSARFVAVSQDSCKAAACRPQGRAGASRPGVGSFRGVTHDRKPVGELGMPTPVPFGQLRPHADSRATLPAVESRCGEVEPAPPVGPVDGCAGRWRRPDHGRSVSLCHLGPLSSGSLPRRSGVGHAGPVERRFPGPVCEHRTWPVFPPGAHGAAVAGRCSRPDERAEGLAGS